MEIANKDILFDIIVNNIDLGIALINRKGYFTYYNDAMGEIEGLDGKDVLGKHVFEVYPTFNEKNSTLYQCMNLGTPVFDELQSYINGKGRKVFSIVTNIPIKIGDDIVGAIEIAKDVDKNEKTYRSVDNWLNKSKNNNMEIEKIRTNYYNFDDFITCDIDITKLINKVKRMAKYDSNVLIYGETGTGKEIFAQSIHNLSQRRNKPFIAQNCAAIPENLLESILFGTEKGSFTGAIDKEGLFEQADGGTLLLDELNSLPIYLQAKLLRVLQEQYVRRVGGNSDKRVDVRVIATVNEDPSNLIQLRRLRQDLFFRLNTLYIYIPPLRDRKKDIFLLIDHYIKKYGKMYNIRPGKMINSVYNFFENYTWEGNVRELINVVEYIIMTIEDNESIGMNHLPYYLLEKIKGQKTKEDNSIKYGKYTYHEMLDEIERGIILDGLDECKWNVTKTAEMLNIKRQTLQNKIRKLKINY